MNQLTRAVPLVALVGFLVLIGLGGCSAASEGLSDQESVAADKAALVIGYAGTDSAASVTQALTLPGAGDNGTTITWASDMTGIIDNDGAVTRPAADAADATVKLTATITKNEESDTKEFSLTVKKALSDADSVAADKAALVIGYAGTDSAASVTQALTLPGAGASGTTITWASSDTAVIANDGTVTRPAANAADASVTLTATIEKNGVNDTKTFTLTVPKMSQADDSAPGKPTNVQAVAGDTTVTVTWAAPTDTGTVSGAAGTITGYKIYYSTIAPVTTSGTFVDVSDITTLSQDVESLTNGTAYYFAVTASNGSGEGDLSAQASATPVAGKQDLASMQLSYPAITMDFGATSSNTASPSWTVPADDVDYSIASRPQGANSGNVTIDTNTGEVTATTNAASADSGDYTIEATAKTGSTSYTGTQTATLTLTITKQTGKPTSVSATPGNEKVTLSWTAPDAGYIGSTVETIQGYKIYYSTTSGATGTLINKSSDPSTRVEITGLTNGTTYYFRVQAVTDQGDGELSDEANGTPQSGKIDLSTLKPGYPETHTHTYVPASTPKTEITPTWVVPDSEVTYSFSARPQLSENAHVHIDFDTGIVTIEAFAQQGDIGTYTVKAVAKDTSTGYTGTATQDFTLTVNAKPESPSITSATPTDAGDIDLAWTLPTETGYSGDATEVLTALEITINPAPTSGEATRSVSASATTETITGLASGTAYSFTMTASNIHGKSRASNEKSATTKSDLSTATLSYEGALEKDYGSADITSNPSWAGGPGTPTSLTYSIAAATTGAPPTEDGITLSSDGISINTTSGLITVGTAVEVKHSGDYVVTATAAAGDANYIAGSTATLTVTVTVKAIAIASLNSAEFSLTVNNTTVTALTGGTHTATVGGSLTLTAGTDYDLSIKKDGAAVTAVTINNAGLVSIADTIGTGDAGTYTVKATGKGNYNGEKTANFALTVDAKDITTVTGFDITVGNQTVSSSTGSTFPVTINNAGLTAGTDYELSIEKGGATVAAVTINNDGLVSIAATIVAGDAGTYTVKATGIGNYRAVKQTNFLLTVEVVYNIGDTGPAGGIVFYVKDSESDGWRYLEAAPSDLPGTYKWGDTAISVTTGTDIGTGQSNTGAIMIAMDGANFTQDYAAKACANYSSGGKDDWFLPSKDELNKLYEQKDTVGVEPNIYWSSSESNASNAWSQYFGTGYQGGPSKYDDKYVRAVRAF